MFSTQSSFESVFEFNPLNSSSFPHNLTQLQSANLFHPQEIRDSSLNSRIHNGLPAFQVAAQHSAQYKYSIKGPQNIDFLHPEFQLHALSKSIQNTSSQFQGDIESHRAAFRTISHSSPSLVDAPHFRCDSSDAANTSFRSSAHGFQLSRYDPTSTAAHLINQYVEQYEPTIIIFDHCSLRDWLRQWQSYKNHGGTKPLRLLLSRPRGTSDVSNFSSLCWFLTPAQRRDEVAILSALHTAFGSPPAAAAETIFTKLINFSSDPQADTFNGPDLSQYMDNYVSTIYEHPHLYSPSADNVIIKLFLKNLYPVGLQISWGLVNSTHLPLQDFVVKFRTHIAQHQALHDLEKEIYLTSSELESDCEDQFLDSSSDEPASFICSTLIEPPSLTPCHTSCMHSPSDTYTGTHCPDCISDQRKVAKVSTSSFSPVSNSSLLPDVPVIFDSGSGATTVPSESFLSSSFRDLNSTTSNLELRTAGDHLFSPISSGTFRGLPSHVVPEFSDVLISLSDLMAAGNFAIVTDSEMTIIESNKISAQLLTEFQHAILHSVKCIAPVVDGIYQQRLADLPSAFVTRPSTARLMNVIHRYETAKFHTISDLVTFFHDLLGHPSIDTMLHIVQSSSIANLPSELTTAAIRRYFPFNCSTCPASQLSRRPPAPLLPSSTSLPGEEFEVDFKGPWTDAAGVQIQSLSGNKYSFTAVDVHADFAYASFARTTKNPAQYLERLRTFVLKKTGNRLKVLRVGNEFMENKSVHSWADQPDVNVTLLPAIPHEHDRITKVERLHRTLQDMVNKSLHGKPHLGSKYWEKSYRHCIDLYNIRPRDSLAGKSPYFLYYNRPYNFKINPIFPFGSVVMGHIPLDSQTAMSGRADEMFFEGVAHDYNNGIKLYNPVSKQTVTRHSYAFVDTQEPVVNTYILPDSSSTSYDISSEFSSLLPPSSSLEGGPISDLSSLTIPSGSSPRLNPDTVSVSIPVSTSFSNMDSDSILVSPPVSASISVEGGPTLIAEEGGPTPLSLISERDLDDLYRWSHVSLPYSSAPPSLRPKYDNIGRQFTDLGLHTPFEITDICKSSAPDFKEIYTFKFYDTSIFSTPPSLDDLYEYEEIDSFLQDSNYRFDSRSYPYLRRRVNQLIAQKRLKMPTIPLSVDQAKVHEHAKGFMSALDEEVSSLWNMSTWKNFLVILSLSLLVALSVPKLYLTLFTIQMGRLRNLKLVLWRVETSYEV